MLISMVIKKAILNLRLKPEVRDEFAIAAALRGASMSGLLHQFIVKTIREEKDTAPQSFEKKGHVSNGIMVAPHSTQKMKTERSNKTEINRKTG